MDLRVPEWNEGGKDFFLWPIAKLAWLFCRWQNKNGDYIYLAGRVQSSREYFSDGSLEREGQMSDVGWVSQEYYPTGKLRLAVVYGHNGAATAEQKYFAESGELIFHFKDGQILVDKTKMLQKRPPNQAPEPTPPSGASLND